MSNDNLDEYKRLYSEYVSHLVDLHNYHHQFIKTRSKQSAMAVRSHIKFMIQFEKRLQVTTLRVVSERIQNDIEAKKNAKTQAKLSIEEEEKWRVAEKIRKRAEEQAKRHEQKRLPKSRGVLKGKKNDNRS